MRLIAGICDRSRKGVIKTQCYVNANGKVTICIYSLNEVVAVLRMITNTTLTLMYMKLRALIVF